MHPRGNDRIWAQAILDGEMDAPQQKRRPAKPFPNALTAAELRAMYERNQTPEVRALLWEIARLHRLARRAHQLSTCFPAYASQSTSSAFAIILAAMRRELAEEVCLNEVEKARPGEEWAEEDFSADPWAAKRAARRRRNG